MTETLYHIHDPMCSWCWAYKPTWLKIHSSLAGTLNIQHILGGLAPDSSEPMPVDMQQSLQSIWKRIEQTVPGTRFNYQFWSDTQPRRSTYPACRAVITARMMDSELEDRMTTAIQEAYYLQARNPSDTETLIELSREIGADAEVFQNLLASPQIEQALNNDISVARNMGIQGFPSLVLVANEDQFYQIPIDYNSAEQTIDQVNSILNKT